MTQTENPPQAAIIQAFLATSRAYLALDDDPDAARHRSIVSNTTAKPDKTSTNSYRKALRSILLAVGLGAFVAGPVMADPGCGQTEEHRTRH